MRRLLLLVVLAGWLVVPPAFAQTTPRRVETVQAARPGARAAAPDALRPDLARLRAAATAKSEHDPRPLRGLDNRHIPRYSSVEAFMAARPSADLRASATPVGTARWITRPVTTRQTPRTASGGKTTAPFALGKAVRLQRAPNETVRWLRGTLGRADAAPGAGKQAAYTQAALTIAEAYADVLGLQKPLDELRPMQTRQDDLGYVHARFEQVYDGLRVWGRDLYVHFDDAGVAYALNGTYEPTPVGLATRPTLDDADALQATIADLQAQGRWAPLPADVAAWLDVEAPQTELVLYPDPDRGMRLAYEVSLHPNLLEWYTYLIDADTGQPLNRIARHCTLHYHPNASAPLVKVAGLTRPQTPAGPVAAQAGFFNATATDLNGQAQTIRVYQHDDNVFYKVWDLDNINQATSQLPDNPVGGGLTIDANSTDFGENVNLTHVTSADNTWNDPASVSAHVNMNIAYEYYRDRHARNAIDGSGQSIISIIHVTDEGTPMDNAFWSGRVMAYGDGAQAFLPLAGALDVAGHEMTHGVIQNTAGLIYQFQSGALNESFADVFGVLIEPNDFLLGEDIMRVNRAALRDLLNPDNPNVLSDQPAHMSQFRNLTAEQDNGGVHINSGIPNRAAALIMQLLGGEDTERIYYRALSTYLTRNSQFTDARAAVEQAAIDLFGANSNEVTVVRQAFDDVGIFGAEGGNDEGNDEGNDLPPQTGGSSLVAFMVEDGSIGLLDVTDFANPTGGLFNDPGAVARVDNEAGDRSQLTTPLDGETIWFINADRKLAILQVESGLVSVFDDLFLQQEGDLWNASIAPNEDFVALVSSYAQDPTLYFFNGEDLGAIDLLVETTQEGIEDQTIQYPDVVSWSPNPQVPHIVFDAFNEVDFGPENTINYWGIYEIDFAAGDPPPIYNLIPAQPTDVSVGNITYSNTDPDVVAFNVVTDNWDVLVGNFETGDVTALDIPSFTVGGQAITDAQRPTFSPDDSQLAFSSPAFGVLLFYDLNAGSMQFLDVGTALGSAPFNPRWFVRGGSGGSSNQAPTAGFTVSASSGEAPLTVNFDAGGLSSDPDGDNLSYHWDFGDGTTGGGPTPSHTFVQAGTLTVTLTVTDSGGLSDTETRQITIDEPSQTTTVTLRSFDPQQAQTVLTVQNDGGFVFGTNSFEDQAKAAAFALPAGVTEAQVTQVNVWFGFKRAASTLNYAIEILDGTPNSGPGDVQGREVFPLSGVNADEDINTAETATTHALSSPVTVGSSFFVSVDFGSYGQADHASASLVTSPLVGSRVPGVWEKWSDGAWHNVSDAWDFGNGEGTNGANPWIEVVAATATGTATEGADELPRTFTLAPNYPNPFSAETTWQVDLPSRADVDLRIVDLLGRTVAALARGPMEAGTHTIRFDARDVPGLPSGVYLARLRAGSAVLTRKMVLVR